MDDLNRDGFRTLVDLNIMLKNWSNELVEVNNQMKLNWGNKYSKELLWASFDSYNMATDLDTNNFVLYDSRLYYLDGLCKYDSGYYLSGSAKVNAFNAAIFEFNQAIELDSNNLDILLTAPSSSLSGPTIKPGVSTREIILIP